MLRQSREAHGFDQAKTTAPQRDFEQQRTFCRVVGALGRLAEHRRLVEGSGELGNGIVARSEDSDAPMRAGVAEEPSVQIRQKAGADERGFSAAGGADDRKKPVAAQSPQDLLALPFAPEEQNPPHPSRNAEDRETDEF